MRSYGQYCALARSLDIVGDRWTLLIIRELFARDSRYTDLREGLPGIATNLLADRLHQLQNNGLIESYEAPPPVRATVYRLTSRGEELGPVLRSLVHWGMPLLDTERGQDAFRPQWLMLALRILLADTDLAGIGPLTLVIVDESEPITVEIGDGNFNVVLGRHTSGTTLEIAGDPQRVFNLLSGTADADWTTNIEIRGPSDERDRLHRLIERVGDARRPEERQ